MLRKGCLAVLLGLFKGLASWQGVCWNIVHKAGQISLTMESKGSVPFLFLFCGSLQLKLYSQFRFAVAP